MVRIQHICITYPYDFTPFFLKSNHFAAMMSTFAVFASGFMMRPLGALFFGHLGDTIGRKKTLLITIFLMSISTTAIGLIPVGTSASTLALVVCRLIQGFATSGEYPGGLTLIAEQSSPKNPGLQNSFGIFSTGAGCFAGALAYTIAFQWLGYDAMLQWGWRILFLISAPLSLLGYLLRRSLLESIAFKKIKQLGYLSHSPILQTLKHHSRTLFGVLCISILTNTLTYINFLYFNNYSVSTHKLTTTSAMYLYLFVTLMALRYTGLSLTLNIAASLFGGTAPMICGWLTHRFHTPLAPLLYVMIISGVALAAMLLIIDKNQQTELACITAQ